MNSLSYPVILIALILSYNYSYGQFNENFSDNELLINPKWVGDINKFNIVDGKLHSNSSVTYDEFYISTKSKRVLETEWQISMDLDFKTSSANYIDIFLASDSSNPSKASQAYFVRIGDTKDDVSLYRIFDGLTNQLTNGSDNKTEKKKIDLHVIHQANGKWTIKVDYNNGYIYNLAGIQVHHPFNNVLLSSNGNLKWDGLDSNGIKLSIGNYILLIEAFNETGKIIKRKIAFGITGIF